jgi:L-lactate utilization protein LutC
VRPAIGSLDRTTNAEAIRRRRSSPDVVLGSVAALTASGSLVVASASGSQLPSYAGGAGRVILVVGSQKIVPDLETALRRVHEYALPLETERALRVYGRPSAVNGILIINRERPEGRTTILIVKDVIGF